MTPGPSKTYTLLGPDGSYISNTPGLLGGYRPKKIFGELDCASAKRAIDKGGYVKSRVFFADQATAEAYGWRPCAKCMPGAYLAWKRSQANTSPPPRRSARP